MKSTRKFINQNKQIEIVFLQGRWKTDTRWRADDWVFWSLPFASFWCVLCWPPSFLKLLLAMEPLSCLSALEKSCLLCSNLGLNLLRTVLQLCRVSIFITTSCRFTNFPPECSFGHFPFCGEVNTAADQKSEKKSEKIIKKTNSP